MNRRRLSFFCALLCLSLSSPLFAIPSPSCNANLAQIQEWYDRQFHQLADQFLLKARSPLNSHAPLQVALLKRIYDLRETVSDPQAVDAFVQAASENKLLSPLARAEAAFLAIQSALHRGTLQHIESRYSALGYVRGWRITEDDFPIDDGASAHWKQFASGPIPWIEISSNLWPDAAYVTLEATIEAAQDQLAVFRFSSETSATVYLNSVAVLQVPAAPTISFDQYTTAIQLRAGLNVIRIRISRTTHSDLRIALRLTDITGEGYDPSSKITSRDPLPPAVPDDLLRIAQEHPVDGAAPNNLGVLFWLKKDRQAPDTMETLTRAVEHLPSADLLFELAQYRPDSMEKTEALHKILASDAEYLPALLKLFEHYWSRGENYKAKQLLQGYLQFHPCEPEPLRALADLKRSQGDFSAALADFKELEKRTGLSLDIRHELANRFAEFGLTETAWKLATSVAEMDFDGTEERQLKIRLEEQALDTASLFSDYVQLHQLYPHDRQILKKLLLFEQQLGKTGEALGDLRAELDLSPHEPELIKARSALLQHTDEPLFSTPLADVNTHLRNLLLGKSSELRQDEDHAYLEDASLLASRWRTLPAGSRSSSRILADVRIERVTEKYLSRSHVQKVLAIATLADAQRLGLETIRYSPESEQLKIIHARALKMSGHIVEAEDIGDSPIADAQSAMYYDVRARNIRFSRLEAGDVIELEYRIIPFESENPYGKYFAELVSFGSEIDKDLQKYVVIAPAQIRIFSEQKGLSPVQPASTSTFRVYEWQATNIKGVVRESRGPSWTEIAPYVHFSTMQSWQDLGNWYAHLIGPQFVLDSALERVAEQIRTRNQTDLQRIQATHEFVIKNTHYVALEFGIYSYKPYPVSQTFQRKFGDCKDKASLTIALLRAMGIEAEIALVRSQRLGKIKSEPASVAIFDHAIAYVPKYDLWLDGTAEFSGLRELPIEDQGAMALTVARDGQSTLREIPVSSPIDNYTWRSVQAELETDGTIHFSGVNYVRGQDAAGMRRELEKTDRKQEFVRGRLAEVLPSVEISSVSVPGVANLEEDLTLSYRGEIQPHMQTGVLSIPSSWIPRPYLAALAPSPTREQELLLQAPWTTEEELHIKLTSGAALTSLPGDLHIDNEFGSATLRYSKTGNEIVVFSSIQFRKVRIQPEEYPAFRAFAETLETAFRREVQVRMP
jgi:transglutaminase-like putative cysteine protease